MGIALQESLLQSTDDTICVFPAWPKEWDGSFELLARGGFLVSSSMQKGDVSGIEITSTWGRHCRVVNPWNGPAEIIRANGERQMFTSKDIIFYLETGDRVMILPAGAELSDAVIALRPGDIGVVQTLRVEFGNGKVDEVQLGM